MGKVACRHCGKRVNEIRRGICPACFRAPAIRAQYPPGKRGPAPTKPPRADRPSPVLTLLQALNDFDAVL